MLQSPFRNLGGGESVYVLNCNSFLTYVGKNKDERESHHNQQLARSFVLFIFMITRPSIRQLWEHDWNDYANAFKKGV